MGNSLKKDANNSSELYSSIYFVLWIVLCFAPLKQTGPRIGLSRFTREIGASVMYDFDINRVVVVMLGWLLLSALAFVIVFKGMQALKNKAIHTIPECADYLFGLNMLALLGMPVLAVQALNIFEGFSEYWLLQIGLVGGLLLLGWGYVLLACVLRFKLLAARLALWAAVLALPLSIAAALLAGRMINRIPSRLFLAIYLGCVLALGILLHLLLRGGVPLAQRLAAAATPLVCLPVVASVYIELRYILTQYGIFLRKPFLNIFLLCVLAVAIGAALFLTKVRLAHWQRVYFPLIIVGAYLLWRQPYFYQTPEPNYFETANFGLAAQQFLDFGKLPVVEAFSSHLLSDFIPMTLFAVLNRDVNGAMILTYLYHFELVWPLVYYFVVSRLFGRGFAFGFVMLFPFYDWAFGWPATAAVCILAMCLVLKKPGWRSYAVYALVMAISCLYILDGGVAYGMGTLLALFAVRFARGGKDTQVKLWAVLAWLAGVALTLLGLFAVLCLANGIPFITRLRELLAVVSSNAHWGLYALGDVHNTAYAWFYLVVPVTVLCLIMGLVLKYRKTPGLTTQVAFASVMAYGLAYVVNLQRAMVRHNLLGLSLHILLYSAPIFIALAATLLVRHRKRSVFIGIMLGVALISHTMLHEESPRFRSISGQMLEKTLQGPIMHELPENTSRVLMVEYQEAHGEIVSALGNLLAEDESFVDLANIGIFYILTGRENPVYVNQSPALVSGEYAQRQFVKQIQDKAATLPIAVTSVYSRQLDISIDGVYNSTRFYYIYEYLYANYTPLGVCDGYLLWAENSKYDALRAEMGKCGLAEWSFDDMDAGIGKVQNIFELPYLWANNDTK